MDASPARSARSRAALAAIAACYLAGVWLDAAGSTLPSRLLPRAAHYFVQIAALFPRAATMSIDYRAEGWVCGARRWVELDTRPYFPLEPDNKENRFQRAMHFFRDDRRTMRALDAYLVGSHDAGTRDDGIGRDESVGGVRLLSLRIPVPQPGGAVERTRRRPLADYPAGERHVFYHTRRSTIAERCRDASRASPEGDE